MPLCYKCNENERPSTGPYCKPCRNSYERIRRNGYDGYKIKQKERPAKALIRNSKETPCTDCGVQYPWYIMDFDHARGIKNFPIAASFKKYGIEKIKVEIAKCDIVCSNYHRERTFKRGYK